MVHVIKVYFTDDKHQTTQVRRVAVSSNVTTYFKLLQEKIQELFQLTNDNFEIKWKDSDGDYVIVSSDGELAQALANAEDDMLRIYTNMKSTENTIPKRPETPKSEVEHPNIVCDACNKSPVNGARYKCLQCVNFDLCSSCNAANKHPGHDMIKLVIPSHIPREWVFIGARKFWRSLFGRCPSSFFAQFNKDKKESEAAKSPESPETEPQGFNNVLSEFLKGDFVEAQKLLGGFIKDISGNIQVQMENCPFNEGKAFNAESKVKVPKSEATNSTPTDNAGKKNAQSEKANEKVEVQAKSPEAKEKKLETPSVLIESTSAPKESTKSEHEDEICIDTIKEKSPSPDTEASTCAEGWTLLLLDDPSPKETTTENKAAEPEKSVKYPDLEELKQKTAESGDAVQTSDPKIINALIKMQAMGFTNEGGWLERLLSTKHGNINEALDALYPFTQRH